jgi:O-antigen ligase
VLATLAIAPLVFLPAGLDPFGLPKLVVVLVGTAVGGGATVLAWSRPELRRRLRPPQVAKLTGLHLAVVAAATLFSPTRLLSFVGAHERYNGLLPLLLHATFGAVVALVAVRRPTIVREALVTIAASGVAVAIYVLVQTAGFDVVELTEKSGAGVRFQAGSLGNSAFAGGWLGVALVALAGLGWRAGRLATRLLAAGGALLCAGGLWATSGRAGMVGAAFGAVTLLVGSLAVRVPPARALTRRRLLPAALAALASTALVFVALVAVSDTGTGPASSSLFRTESLAIRGWEWSSAVEMVADRPILGWGPEGFGQRYASYRPPKDGAILGLQIADKPHNVVLEQAVTGGLLGLAAWVALVIGIGRWAVRRSLEPDTETDTGAEDAGLVLAVLVAYLSQASFSIDVPPFPALFWFLAGAAGGAQLRALVGAAAPTRTKKRAAGPAPIGAARVAVAGAGAAVAVMLLAALPLRADVIAGRALRAQDLSDAIATAERAADLAPWNTSYRLQVASLYEAAGAQAQAVDERARLLQRATEEYDAVLAREPTVAPLVGAARTATLMSRGVAPDRFPVAESRWRAVLAADPYDWQVHEEYGLMLNSWANVSGDLERRRQAEDALQVAAFLRGGDQLDIWLNLALIRNALGDDAGVADALARADRLDEDDAAVARIREQVNGGS